MMNKQITDRLFREYAALRAANAAEEDRRLAFIREKHPSIAKLLDERHKMVLNAAASLFRAVPQDPEAMMLQYNARIRQELVDNGYPEDYLQPICRCERCRDTGLTGENSNVLCDCFRKAYAEQVSAGSESISARQTFAAFDLSVFPEEFIPEMGMDQREFMEVVRDRCKKYAASLPDPARKTLLITGSSGLGKTYLLNCIRNEAADRNIENIAVSAFDLLENLKNAYFGNTDADSAVYFDTPLLLIDDLGTEPLMQNVTIEHIYHLINSRMSAGKCTVITTNLSAEDMRARYNERLSSRLNDRSATMLIPLRGVDVRSDAAKGL